MRHPARSASPSLAFALALGLSVTMLAGVPNPAGAAGRLAVESATRQVPGVALQPVPGAFELPVAMALHPDSDDLYIAQKTGSVVAVRDGLVYDPTPVLDLTDVVSDGLEQGLLGLTFSPSGDHLYVNYTDTAGTTRVVEYAFAAGVADASTARELLSIEQPYENHNGGTLAFGPDGMLYISTGDGGSGGDPGYRAQSLDTRLGKVLRIDPTPSVDAPYTIPGDNPFVPRPFETPPPAGALQEIWAYGLRNPWKISFDRDTGDLWIADVGQSTWEEINLQRAAAEGGANYGWNHMEGLEPFDRRPSGATEPADHVPPLHVYAYTGMPNACSISGGNVYRGDAIPSLQGAYIFSDWCDGLLRYVIEEDGVVVESGDLGVAVPLAVGFGEDRDGELYVLTLQGVVAKLLPTTG